MPKPAAADFDLRASLISAFATNNRVTCYLIENVPTEAWSAKVLGEKGRNIAEIAAHIHNVRLMWLKAAGVAKLPAKLQEGASSTETIHALSESHAGLAALLSEDLATGQMKNFKPDAAAFYAYLIAHDAHHRGQIAFLAKKLGYPLPKNVGFGMWEWGSRAKEI